MEYVLLHTPPRPPHMQTCVYTCAYNAYGIFFEIKRIPVGKKKKRSRRELRRGGWGIAMKGGNKMYTNGEKARILFISIHLAHLFCPGFPLFSPHFWVNFSDPIKVSVCFKRLVLFL